MILTFALLDKAEMNASVQVSSIEHIKMIITAQIVQCPAIMAVIITSTEEFCSQPFLMINCKQANRSLIKK